MTNTEIVEKFYLQYSKLNAEGMISCLAEDIIYNDPVYGIIKGAYVESLWYMRCKNLKSLAIDILELKELDHEYITCKWHGSFYSHNGHKNISMNITSYMKIGNKKITEHSDAYRLSDWLAKAYGITGQLLGWSGWMKKRELHKCRVMLQKFSESRQFFDAEDKRRHDYDYSDR